MTRTELVSRWMSSAGRELAFDVALALVSGNPVDPVRTGLKDGRLDLRGFSLPPAETIRSGQVGDLNIVALQGVLNVRGISWADLDLSYASLPNLRFTDAVIDNCVLDHAELRDWRFWSSMVSRSTFFRADLRDSSLVGPTDALNSWNDVSFDRANLRGMWIRGPATFEGCTFRSTLLEGVRFIGCRLIKCTFSGPMRDVLFDFRREHDRRATFANVDFSDATFRDVEFKGSMLETVALPTSQDLVRVPHHGAVMRRQLALLPDNDSLEVRQLRAILETGIRSAGRKDSTGVFNRQDWVEWGGEPLAALAETTLGAALTS